MVKRVNTPDGVAEFPDNMSDADIERVLQQEYGGPAQTQGAAPRAEASRPAPNPFLDPRRPNDLSSFSVLNPLLNPSAERYRNPTNRRVLGEGVARFFGVDRPPPTRAQARERGARDFRAAGSGVAQFLGVDRPPPTRQQTRERGARDFRALAAAPGAARTTQQRLVEGVLSHPVGREAAVAALAGPALALPTLLSMPHTREAAREAGAQAPSLASEYTFRPGADVADLRPMIEDARARGDMAEVERLSSLQRERIGAHELNSLFGLGFDLPLVARGAASGVKALARRARPMRPGEPPRAGQPPEAPPPEAPPPPERPPRQPSIAEQARAAEAEAAPLEEQFGPLTRGERRGVASERLDEENMRLGMGSAQAQSTMRGFDARRAQQIRENAMRLVTRGRPALSQDVGEAGVVFADELRTARENMAAQRTELYEEARPLLEGEVIAQSNDTLSAALEATAKRHFADIPAEARTAIAQFEDEVRAGTANQARLEGVRQAFNRALSTASEQRNVQAEYVIGELIGALDDWQLARLANPEARRAITEARGIHRELQQLFAEQNRVELATGHVGRTDLGGRAVERVLNEDRTGEQIIDGMIGRGGRPTPQTLGAVKRVIEIDNSIQYTNRAAESGVRVPGRPKVGGRTAGERRFAADDPAAPPTSQNPRGGMEQPKPMTQALREGFWHRMLSPIDDYLSRVEATGVGREGGLLPARRMVTQLDNALNGSGREITALLYTERERAAMQQLLTYFKRLVPPAGANYSGTAIAIYRAIGRALESVANAIPGLGWTISALRSIARDFSSTVRAERAIAPVRPRGRPQRPPAPATGAAEPPPQPVPRPQQPEGNRPAPGMTPQAEGRSGIPGPEMGITRPSTTPPKVANETTMMDRMVGERTYTSPRATVTIHKVRGRPWHEVNWHVTDRQVLPSSLAERARTEQEGILAAIEALKQDSAQRGAIQYYFNGSTAALKRRYRRLAQAAEEAGFEVRHTTLGGIVLTRRAAKGGGSGLLPAAIAGGAVLGTPSDAQAQESPEERRALSPAGATTLGELEALKARAPNPDAPRGDPAVRAFQADLKRLGYYGADFTPDGIWGPGTDRAVEALNADIREATRKFAEEEAVRRNAPGQLDEFTRANSGFQAAVGGYALGHLSRLVATRGRAHAADRFLPQGRPGRFPWSPRGQIPPVNRASAADRNQRFSRLNEFWRAGGAGENVPFRTTEGARGWAARAVKDTATPSSLFPRRTGAAAVIENRLGVGDAAVIGSAAVEYHIAEANFRAAERRVEAAQRAYDADRENDAKRHDLENAITEMHRWEAAMNLGRGIGAGRALGILGHRYHIARPNLAAAETELGALRRYARSGK